MDFDKKNMTLDEAIAVIKEIEPMHERTNSGRAESLILQSVHDGSVVPVVRCKDCKHYRQELSKHRDDAVVVWCAADNYPVHAVMPDDWFCAGGQRRE